MIIKLGVLFTAALAVAKLLGFFTFSWWWVFSPVPIAIGLAIAIPLIPALLVVLIGALIAGIGFGAYGICLGIGAIINAFKR